MPFDLQQELLSPAPNRQAGQHLQAQTRSERLPRSQSRLTMPRDHDSAMSTRAPSLAVRLLTTARAGAALGTMTGCLLLFSCPERWSARETVELETLSFHATLADLVGEIPHDASSSVDPLDPLDREPAQQAIADDLEHARQCFDLASRHVGAALGPGALGLLAKPTIFGTVSDSRAGDPVAIALAMLEEGCINESEAAAKAAVAALQCREARAKSMLERIAADETRRAPLAWRTPRGLLESHPEVAPPHRVRLAQLASPARPMSRSNVSGSAGADSAGRGGLWPTLWPTPWKHGRQHVARLRVVVISGPALA
jgi:hypothetical protein